MTVEQFADSLQLTRAGLHKAMKGKSVPSLDLIERARVYGVDVGYGDLDIAVVQQKGKSKKNSPEAQLYLPFAIDGLQDENIQIQVGRKEPDAVEFKVRIRFAG